MHACCISLIFITRARNLKEIWTPQLGDILLVSQVAGNVHDRRAVALLT